MGAAVEVYWCVGHQVLDGSYLRERTRAGTRLHIKTVGKLTMLPDTAVGDIEDTVDAVWVLGRISAPPDVRRALQARRRWKVSTGPRRRDRTVRIRHQETTTNGLTTDHSLGRVWFDRFELQKRAEAGRRVDLTVRGVLWFAPDVTVALVNQVFARVKLHGLVFGPPAVRAAVRALDTADPT